MIAASDCNLTGERWPTSQYQNNNRVFAFGVDIRCAPADGPSAYQVMTGTSFCEYFKLLKHNVFTILLICSSPAAPLVAGVLANMMATGEIVGFGNSSAWDMHTVRGYAGWQRPAGQYVIWNHVGREHNPPSGLLLNAMWFNHSSAVDIVTS